MASRPAATRTHEPCRLLLPFSQNQSCQSMRNGDEWFQHSAQRLTLGLERPCRFGTAGLLKPGLRLPHGAPSACNARPPAAGQTRRSVRLHRWPHSYLHDVRPQPNHASVHRIFPVQAPDAWLLSNLQTQNLDVQSHRGKARCILAQRPKARSGSADETHRHQCRSHPVPRRRRPCRFPRAIGCEQRLPLGSPLERYSDSVVLGVRRDLPIADSPIFRAIERCQHGRRDTRAGPAS